jgi:6-phosphofructokinase 2
LILVFRSLISLEGVLLTQIITVTPNPAIDVSTSVGKLAPFTKLRCAAPRHDPGGGGINVARVIKRLGSEVTAIYPAGGAAGSLLRRLVDREGVRSVAVPVAEETRKDFTVFEVTTNQQYRFVMPGPPLSEPEWQDCLRQLVCVEPRPDFVITSGSLPPGVPEDFHARIARVANERGAKVIVDTSGVSLKAAVAEGVHCIKPNLREFQELTGVQTADHVALIAAGRGLIARAGVKLIALSLGPQGALLITDERALHADGLPIKPASVVGAGDSFVGALAWSLARDDDLDVALRFGVAAGSAALLRPGTDLCRFEDVQRLAPQVIIRPVSVGVG